MKDIVRGLVGRARALESRIARTVEGAAQRVARSGGREPLEIAHAVVDAVEAKVQASGRGRQLFPFNALTVSVVAPTREARVRQAAEFDGDPPLRARIVERLEAAGCPVPELSVTVTFAAHAKAGWLAPDFHVVFDRLDTVPAAAPLLRAAPRHTTPAAGADRAALLELTVLHGSAERNGYTFEHARVDIGRCADVRDDRHRLVRTNHVAFLDTPDPINQGVSRQHAHIAVAGGGYRLFDDRSAQGTSVVRDGRTVPVPPGTRGVLLRTGDEIVLGRARLRVSLHLRVAATADPPAGRSDS